MDVAAQWNLQRLRFGICEACCRTQSWYFLLHLLQHVRFFDNLSLKMSENHRTFGPSDSTSAWSKIFRQIFAQVTQCRTIQNQNCTIEAASRPDLSPCKTYWDTCCRFNPVKDNPTVILSKSRVISMSILVGTVDHSRSLSS